MCTILYMWRNQYLVPKQWKRYDFTVSCTLNIIKCDQILVYILQAQGHLICSALYDTYTNNRQACVLHVFIYVSLIAEQIRCPCASNWWKFKTINLYGHCSSCIYCIKKQSIRPMTQCLWWF